MLKQLKATVIVMSLITAASWSGVTMASTVEERPTGVAMAADAILVRPTMTLGLLAGTAVYVVSLPISLLGGNADEAGKKLVVSPFKATFLRCLGCTKKHVPEAEYY